MSLPCCPCLSQRWLVCLFLICLREELGACWRGKLTWTSPEPSEAVSLAGARPERWTPCGWEVGIAHEPSGAVWKGTWLTW